MIYITRKYLDMGENSSRANNYLFVFIEVFACEGGIQSYVKDIFQAYSTFKEDIRGEVFCYGIPLIMTILMHQNV